MWAVPTVIPQFPTNFTKQKGEHDARLHSHVQPSLFLAVLVVQLSLSRFDRLVTVLLSPGYGLSQALTRDLPLALDEFLVRKLFLFRE